MRTRCQVFARCTTKSLEWLVNYSARTISPRGECPSAQPHTVARVLDLTRPPATELCINPGPSYDSSRGLGHSMLPMALRYAVLVAFVHSTALALSYSFVSVVLRTGRSIALARRLMLSKDSGRDGARYGLWTAYDENIYTNRKSNRFLSRTWRRLVRIHSVGNMESCLVLPL